jgi:hypothetical protein
VRRSIGAFNLVRREVYERAEITRPSASSDRRSRAGALLKRSGTRQRFAPASFVGWGHIGVRGWCWASRRTRSPRSATGRRRRSLRSSRRPRSRSCLCSALPWMASEGRLLTAWAGAALAYFVASTASASGRGNVLCLLVESCSRTRSCAPTASGAGRRGAAGSVLPPGGPSADAHGQHRQGGSTGPDKKRPPRAWGSRGVSSRITWGVRAFRYATQVRHQRPPDPTPAPLLATRSAVAVR